MPRKKSTKKQYVKAPMKLRIGAYLIDIILLFIVRVLLGSVLDVVNFSVNPEFGVISQVLSFILIYGYFITLTQWSGGLTIGKKLLGIQTVSSVGRLKLRQIFIRYFILFVIINGIPTILGAFNINGSGLITLVISLFVLIGMFYDRQHRGVHDLIAGTRVVRG